MKKPLFYVKITISLYFAIFLNVISAQNSDEPAEVTTTYFIKNAHVVQKPGILMENASILIKDGMIQSVGKNLTPPFDAMIIDADSMYVYAGFIDAASHTGISKKEEGEQNRGRISNPGNPTNQQAGITPEAKATVAISASDKSIQEMRKYGFTISHVVPNGRMLPGRGAIISLGGDVLSEMVIHPESSLFAQWQTARGAYPATIIGMIAKWRDLANNARNMNQYADQYKMNPTGKPRPKLDLATEAMIPVVKKELPVFFVAEDVLDIHRALSLANELGLDMVLTDVKQIDPVMDRVKSSGVPVLLSIDLPDEIKDNEEKKKEKGKTKSEETETGKEETEMGEKTKEEKTEKPKKEKKVKKEKKKDPEIEALEARKKEAYEVYLAQAGKMEKAGMDFGFSFIGGKVKDFKSNVNRMIEKGLSMDAALAAVTTSPAKLLGIDKSYGTVESGKMAHLVITDKPYFDEKSNVRFVFIDGTKYDYKVKEKKKSDNGDKPAKVAGVWSYEIEVPGMTRTGNFKITQGDGGVTVSLSNQEAPDDYLECTDVDLSGNNLTFNADIEDEGMSFNLAFDLDFDEDTLEGSVDVGQFGNFPVSGSKTSSPE